VTHNPSLSQHDGYKHLNPGEVQGWSTTPHPQLSRPGTLQIPPGGPTRPGLYGQPWMHVDPGEHGLESPGVQWLNGLSLLVMGEASTWVCASTVCASSS
jgi:hypothetical protein